MMAIEVTLLPEPDSPTTAKGLTGVDTEIHVMHHRAFAKGNVQLAHIDNGVAGLFRHLY
ncbi:MAG: hypothetical protein R8G60_03820 [Roseovarius pacificus]|nr:hypothetical protein [Roseovarius pacificus]